ncbi:TetR family transcriptional regulator [Brenneria populi subsp. brevivirga]|uniref:TetR family transcriptional regulator n=1 Tax=Brenneria populi TaxID=1505588 RepID=UPI002E197A05|nr:TetR family transcriptional regulator [Brenneria populi subsp. brevivirga]
MSKRDPVETRRKLLDAAVTEFAANGLAGARIDRISAAAGISKPMLYVYFGDKEALFDAALAREIMAAAEIDYFDPEDLPNYAGRMYDLLVERPYLWRLMTWFHLERGQDALLIPEGQEVLNAKQRGILAAQAKGIVTTVFQPTEIVRLVSTLIQLWCMAPPAGSRKEHKSRRDTITHALQRLLAPAQPPTKNHEKQSEP